MASDAHLKVLRQGSDAWNAWRIRNEGAAPDLSGADLSAVPLAKCNLSGASLKGARLDGTDLAQCDLSGADLTDCSLQKSTLKDVNLEGAVCQGTDLRGALLRRVRLSKAVLQQVDMSEATLQNVDFSDVDEPSRWRQLKFIGANLTGASFREMDLTWTRFDGAKLTGSNFDGAKLSEATFAGADLRSASLRVANLDRAELRGANMQEADLSGASLRGTDLNNADLRGGNLERTQMLETKVSGANLSRCRVYGASVWALEGVPSEQTGLAVTPVEGPAVVVDELDMAQFVYLLLDRTSLRRAIDAVTSKAVLVLGRFTPQRKPVLEGIAAELRKTGFLPIIFDFDRPESRGLTETIRILAALSLFVIVDLTDPSSAPLELQAIVPNYRIPFVPIIQSGTRPFAMFRDLAEMYEWVVMPVVEYSTVEQLRGAFGAAVVDRAWEMRRFLAERRDHAETVSVQAFLNRLNRTA